MTGLLSVVGGLGLFLLGMAVMTDGLKSITGRLLRAVLSRFTQNPLKGALTGTITTALVQSSSATTVMAVGFVGAGLLTFPQALGVIFGANIGTTITGWLVALLGFKLSLGQIVLPLVFVGALLRLFGNRLLSAWGLALAGFALVFIGISELQQGLDYFKDDVTPDIFPPNTWFGRFLLVLIGIAITLVTQSSSAGVATAITAVHVGNISLSQAAAMVIGMDVGTTVTAAIAVIGGSTEAKRTGLAHVIYNLMTGVAAFFLLPIYIYAWESLATQDAKTNAEIALVLFHTIFNTLGVLAVLPLTYQFASLIQWLIPSQGNDLVLRLDSSLLKAPDIALENVEATLHEIVNRFFPIASKLLTGQARREEFKEDFDDIDEAIEKSNAFMQQIDTTELDEINQQKGLAILHILDHLARLSTRFRKQEVLDAAAQIPELKTLRAKLGELLLNACDPAKAESSETPLMELWDEVDKQANDYRPMVMQQTVARKLTIDEALQRLDTFRWFRRICHHVWRIVFHMQQDSVSDMATESEPETDL